MGKLFINLNKPLKNPNHKAYKGEESTTNQIELKNSFLCTILPCKLCGELFSGANLKRLYCNHKKDCNAIILILFNPCRPIQLRTTI